MPAVTTRVAVGHFTECGYDFGLWAETKFFSEASLKEKLLKDWYKRVMMIPVIVADGVNYLRPATPKERTKACNLYPERELTFLSVEKLDTRFYRD